MLLILHQCLKDLRAQRWPLALWLAVLLADAAAQALEIDLLVAAEHLETLVGVLLAVGLCLVVFGWVIAVMIVQADALDNPSAFWLTRPLSPGALLASKLLVIVPLFLLLPTAAACGVAAANGAHGTLLLQFALERLALATALLLPVLVAGSVAHNLPRMILVLAGAALLYTVVHSLAMVQAALFPRLSARDYMLARSTGVLVAGTMAMVISALLLVHQYLTRATRRTLALAAVAVTLTVAAGDFWPWNLLPDRRPPRVDVSVFDPASVRLAVDEAGLRRGDTSAPSPRLVSASSEPDRRPTVEVRGFMKAEGVPPGWILRVLGGEGEARFGDRTWTAKPYGLSTGETPYTRHDPGAGLAGDVKLAFEQALQARVVNASRIVDGISVHLFDVPETDFQALQGVPGAFTATLRVEASRVVLSPPISLERGASASLAGQGVTIGGVYPAAPPDVLSVRVARTRTRFFASEPDIHLVVRNRRTREAFFPGQSPGLSVGYGILIFGRDLTVSRSTLVVPATTVPIDARWLADAELLIAAITPVGTFEKRLALERFVLPQMYYYKQ